MLKVRLIPTLLLKNGRMVKPKKFGQEGERDVGFPKTTARIYNSQDADELLFLDITASSEGREFLMDTLMEVSKNCFIPLTAGGGINSIKDIHNMLRAGADKVSINTAAIKNPEFIQEASNKFGSQCIVVSIDVKETSSKKYEVFINRGKTPTGLEPVQWAKEVTDLGAGEILLTSIDKEGTMQGYDIELIKKISDSVSIPVIANGGAGTRQDFVDAIRFSHASAVSSSSVFHFSDSNITQVKSFMFNSGIAVRPI